MLHANIRYRQLHAPPVRHARHSFTPANRRHPCVGHCLYNVLAVASTLCATPSESYIVTRQDRIAINRKLFASFRFLHSVGEQAQE
jgi:hypothetical protein